MTQPKPYATSLLAHGGWKPDRTASQPLGRQIADHVRRLVSDGHLPVGSRLPSQRQLAEAFGVNRSTVVDAIDELARCGVVETHGSAGTTITSNTWSLLLPRDGSWQGRVDAGSFRENNAIVQTINAREFDDGLLRLGTAELDPRLFPADIWRDALAHLAETTRKLGYAEPLGLRELREQLARHLVARGVPATPDEIIVTSGSLQGLQLAAACLPEPGTVVYAEDPTYARSLQVFPSAGMTLAGVGMDEGGLDTRALERLVAAAPRTPHALYAIPTNHNPTGITMSEGRRRDLMRVSRARGIPIIEDDAYGELLLDGPSAPPPLKALDDTGAVLYLGTVSKSLAAGLRIGWMVAPRAVVRRLGDVKMQIDYGASSVSQLVLARVLETGDYDAYLGRLLPELRRRRACALDALARHFSDLAVWNAPRGGFFVWLRFRRPVPTERLFASALAENILLSPGDIYAARSTNALRLSYSYATPEEFEQGLAKLAPLVRSLAEE